MFSRLALKFITFSIVACSVQQLGPAAHRSENARTDAGTHLQSGPTDPLVQAATDPTLGGDGGTPIPTPGAVSAATAIHHTPLGTETGSSRTKVCLSPGHPSEPDDKLFEAIINRKVCYFLKDLLKQAGYEAMLAVTDIPIGLLFSSNFDNESPTFQSRLKVVTPEQKAQVCNEWGAQYLIAIHHNYAYDPKENHTLVLYADDANFEPRFENANKWASLTATQLKGTMAVTKARLGSDLDLIGYSLTILSASNAIGILTEASFYSNPKERARLNTNGYLREEARAIFRAFQAFDQTYGDKTQSVEVSNP